MPIAAITHIQKTAPGPPSVIAIATPAMFPVPTREASPIAKAWKGEMPPASAWRDPATVLTILPTSRTCIARVRTVNQMPTPASR